MVKQHKKNGGFTLIELMIATSVLMLVLYSGYYAYSLYSSSWQKHANSFWHQTNSMIGLKQLGRAIEGIQPYVISDKDKNYSFYFQGSNSQLKFVTVSPIFAAGSAIVEIEMITRDGEGGLLYKESSLLNNPALTQNENREWQHQIILLDKVSSLEILYFGYKNLEELKKVEAQKKEQIRGERIELPKWYSHHESSERRILPINIGINIQRYEQKQSPLVFAIPQNTHHWLYKYLREGV